MTMKKISQSNIYPLSERKKRARGIVRALKKLFPAPEMSLQYGNPWELLVAVMLSAQCTDKRVNEVTRVLFKKYPAVADYANADRRELERDIYSTGFYRAKAKHVQESARIVLAEYGGKVPQTITDLMRLPGVGRKTAIVVSHEAFSRDGGGGEDDEQGIAVDTHVRRLARLFGLTTEYDPKKIERDLMAIIPRTEWAHITHRLIAYGRTYCPARPKHLHDKCPLGRFEKPL